MRPPSAVTPSVGPGPSWSISPPAPLDSLLAKPSDLLSAVSANNRKVVAYLSHPPRLAALVSVVVDPVVSQPGDDPQEVFERASLAARVLAAEPGVVGDALVATSLVDLPPDALPRDYPVPPESEDAAAEASLVLRLFDMSPAAPHSVLACEVLASLLRRHAPGVADLVHARKALVRDLALAFPLAAPLLALLAELVSEPSSARWVVDMGIVEALVAGVRAPLTALPGTDDDACATRDSALLCLHQWVEWSRVPAAHVLRVYLFSRPVVVPLVKTATNPTDTIAAAGAVDVLAAIVHVVEASTTDAGGVSPASSPRPVDTEALVDAALAVVGNVIDALNTTVEAARHAAPGAPPRLGLYAYKLVHLLAIVITAGSPRALEAYANANVPRTLLRLVDAFPLHNCMANYAHQVLVATLATTHASIEAAQLRETMIHTSDAHAILLSALTAVPDERNQCNRGHFTSLATLLENSGAPPPRDPDLAAAWSVFVAGPLAASITVANAPLGGSAPPRLDMSTDTLGVAPPAADAPPADGDGPKPMSTTNALVDEYVNLRGMGANLSLLPDDFVANDVDWDEAGAPGEYELPSTLDRAAQWTVEPMDFVNLDDDAVGLVDSPRPDPAEPMAMSIGPEATLSSVWHGSAAARAADTAIADRLALGPRLMDDRPLDAVPISVAATESRLASAEAHARTRFADDMLAES
ncbi:uncharacterized protein AMSG_01911 [Thecamonas trahens ATCC 50062]|uniref:Uncharacterized protein n=1 Tax=Thecamonas trahens ATCC 50062 TaxID=461836 RepID=A0A0L0DTX1_THETB|nr:hypothetical protein AMSG_01911 [Thecamonas trahens ATCC 50062]KNC55642.1 hypothetical protein AMSG_01911 [Thecamonas trahens ATCC 50062]|eukprot:XP_013761412.1 hypothetical protein AMSG_01911 [Thecamonas trahens ATCC 50062]